LEIGDQSFHLTAVRRQILAVQAPSHAAVDAVGQREYLVVHQHRESRKGGNEWRREGLEPCVQMTILAGEIVTGIAHGGIALAFADIARCVGDEVPPVADEIGLWPLPQPVTSTAYQLGYWPHSR